MRKKVEIINMITQSHINLGREAPSSAYGMLIRIILRNYLKHVV
jgi:hypothetical protein